MQQGGRLYEWALIPILLYLLIVLVVIKQADGTKFFHLKGNDKVVFPTTEILEVENT